MGFWDSLGETLGSSLRAQINSAQSASRQAGSMSNERLEAEAKKAIANHDYAKAAAYGKEYQERKNRK